MLLASERVTSRIHRMLFAAADAMGAIAGLQLLRERLGFEPHAISGICSASPLAVEELREFTDVPVVSNTQRDLKQLSRIIL